MCTELECMNCHRMTQSDGVCEHCGKLADVPARRHERAMSSDGQDKHRDHSLKIGLRCAEALAAKWPTLHLDGFDVDEAAALISAYIPSCMVELELEMEQHDRENPPVPVDTSRSIGSRLRKALGVEDVSTIEAIELAILQLAKHSRA